MRRPVCARCCGVSRASGARRVLDGGSRNGHVLVAARLAGVGARDGLEANAEPAAVARPDHIMRGAPTLLPLRPAVTAAHVAAAIITDVAAAAIATVIAAPRRLRRALSLAAVVACVPAHITIPAGAGRT